MRRMLLPLLSFAFVVLFAPASRAADDDAKSIIVKAIKAHGGKEALNKYKGAKITNKGKITIPMIGETDFTSEVTYMLPDKFKDSTELTVGGNKIGIVTVAKGDKFSIESNGMEITVTDAIKKVLTDARYMMKINRLVPLVEDKGYKLEGLGEIKVEDKPAVGVRVTSKGHKDINLYFYKDSGLIAKVEYRSTDPMTEKEFTEERIIVEYKKEKVDGLAVAKSVLVKRDGKEFMKAESEVKFLESVDDSEFDK